VSLSTAPGPSRGTWDIRIPTGIVQNFYGSTISSSTEIHVGLDFGYHLSRTTALIFGLAGRWEENFYGGEAHVDVRYRAWDLNTYVKPFLLGGIGHSWDLPRTAKDKNTITAINLRMGGGVDFAISPRALWGLQIVVDPGPRILPNVTSYFNASFTAQWTFLL
jgi:hypothetical protein